MGPMDNLGLLGNLARRDRAASAYRVSQVLVHVEGSTVTGWRGLLNKGQVATKLTRRLFSPVCTDSAGVP